MEDFDKHVNSTGYIIHPEFKIFTTIKNKPTNNKKDKKNYFLKILKIKSF